MNRAERQLCDFLYDIENGYANRPGEGRLGHFFSYLFHAMAHADPQNLALLNLAFDDQVNAWKRYKREDGYWRKIKDQYDRGG